MAANDATDARHNYAFGVNEKRQRKNVELRAGVSGV